MKLNLQNKKVKIGLGVAGAIVGLYFISIAIMDSTIEKAHGYEMELSSESYAIEKSLFESDKLIQESGIDFSKYKDIDESIAKINGNIKELKDIVGYVDEDENSNSGIQTMQSAPMFNVINDKIDIYEDVEKEIDKLISTYDNNKDMKEDKNISEMMDELKNIDTNIDR